MLGLTSKEYNVARYKVFKEIKDGIIKNRSEKEPNGSVRNGTDS